MRCRPISVVSIHESNSTNADGVYTGDSINILFSLTQNGHQSLVRFHFSIARINYGYVYMTSSHDLRLRVFNVEACAVPAFSRDFSFPIPRTRVCGSDFIERVFKSFKFRGHPFLAKALPIQGCSPGEHESKWRKLLTRFVEFAQLLAA